MAKGECWRILTSKLLFLETRNALIAIYLIYNFRQDFEFSTRTVFHFHDGYFYRIFERRYGSRKFASQLLSVFLLSTIFELGISSFLSSYGSDIVSFLGLALPSKFTSDYVAENDVFSTYLAIGP